MEWQTAAGIVITAAVMLSAAVSDWRHREVPDIHWWVLGLSGIVLTALSLSDIGYREWMMLAGSVLILFAILPDWESPGWADAVIFAAMAVLFVYPMATGLDDPDVRRLAVIPISFAVFYALFLTGVLRGGADAKCMMVLAMMFQYAPSMGALPLIPVPPENVQIALSFPVSVLFHAALFSFVWLIWAVAVKARNGDRISLRNLSWIRMDIGDARGAHVWAKQDVIEGNVVSVAGVPDDGVYDRLEAAGAKDVWVTPIIPFMVPIAAAIIFIITAGSILAVPFSL